MNRYRTIIRLLAVLAAVALGRGCGDGDGPTAPPAPEPDRPTMVTVSPATAALTELGAAVQLTAEVRDQNDRVMAGVTVTWTSSASSVATVDASGLVTGVAEGVATITASVGSASGSAVVTVMQPVASVEVSPSAETIGLGSTLQLTAEGFDETGAAVGGAKFSWESSDAAVATVDASGLVTGVTVGVATITASAGSGQGTAEITVMDLERAALVALYETMDGPNWVNSDNWLTEAQLGDWYGVETNREGRVVSLALSYYDNQIKRWIGNNVAGPIPPELGGLTRLERLNLRDNHVSGAIPPELGGLAHLERLDLEGNSLSGPIPPELGNLANLKLLRLGNNQLSGPIPPELGALASLEWLSLPGNGLTGPLPSSFLKLPTLSYLAFFANDSLCAPGTVEFSAWLEGHDRHRGPLCNENDRVVLESLFETTGGSGWANTGGWLGSPALAGWHGVSADSLGHVTGLDLSSNGLVGRLLHTMGDLAQLTELLLEDNPDLSGRLPPSLVRLSLRVLHYPGTNLCVPTDPVFREWLNAIPSHEGTGVGCTPLSDRDILEVLYHATGGPNWTNRKNWLTDQPLDEWNGVSVDGSGRVRALTLRVNNLTGSIPPELGSLTGLEVLDLRWNRLSGSIPLELSSLANLSGLYLSGNELSGSIPPELGGLAELTRLYLNGNELSGPIPPELGGLAELTHLYLDGNELSGPIPPELGSLSNLSLLHLGINRLSGSIPPELGGLAELTRLYLNGNELSGPIPPEFGGLASLVEFVVAVNADMSGPLPASLTSLQSLETFSTGGTMLCAPSDHAFLEWLATVPTQRVALCEGEPVMAYLVQAVQSPGFPVPLVAGEEALLRVFITAAHTNQQRLPPVRASFHLDGAVTYMAEIPGKLGPIPTDVYEGSLAQSVNAVIPAHVIQPGLEMVVEIDPDGTLDPGLGVATRVPETGRIPVDVRGMPLFDLTVVPFLWSADPDSAILDQSAGMAADPAGHELLELTRILMPVRDLEVTPHEPVLSSSNDAYVLYAETKAIRALEGSTGHYMGMMSGSVRRASGLGQRPGRVSFSVPRSSVLAHELGHNMSLNHGTSSSCCVDPQYPYPDGAIGAWGYDFRNGGRLVTPSTRDVMAGGGLMGWISDYHFDKTLRFRLSDEGNSAGEDVAASSTSLLLWGGVDSEGVPFLEPAFVVDALAALPDSAGQYVVSGSTASGSELFSLNFVPPETADGDGSSSFAFVLPVQPGWADNLANITLSGPGSSATLDRDTDLAMSILIDASTGQVRGILRDLPQADVPALAPQPGPDDLDVLFSRGIPDAAAWSR